jgi:hypothetical protein
MQFERFRPIERLRAKDFAIDMLFEYEEEDDGVH